MTAAAAAAGGGGGGGGASDVISCRLLRRQLSIAISSL